MAKTPSPAARKTNGLGFLPQESRHGFLIHVPKGSAKGEVISISEYRGDRFSGAAITDLPAPPRAPLAGEGVVCALLGGGGGYTTRRPRQGASCWGMRS